MCWKGLERWWLVQYKSGKARHELILQGDLCENQRCPSSGNPRPRRGGQAGNNNRWRDHGIATYTDRHCLLQSWALPQCWLRVGWVCDQSKASLRPGQDAATPGEDHHHLQHHSTISNWLPKALAGTASERKSLKSLGSMRGAGWWLCLTTCSPPFWPGISLHWHHKHLAVLHPSIVITIYTFIFSYFKTYFHRQSHHFGAGAFQSENPAGREGKTKFFFGGAFRFLPVTLWSDFSLYTSTYIIYIYILVKDCSGWSRIDLIFSQFWSRIWGHIWYSAPE